MTQIPDGDDLLPDFRGPRGGSGCENPDCNASDRHIRVLSVHEIERAYPQKATLPYWPIPPQATHICDKCGYVYSGVHDSFEFNVEERPMDGRPDVDIEAYEWDPESVYGDSIRDAADALVAGAPESADGPELIEAIERYIPGLGTDDAETIVEASDRDVTAFNASDFM